MSDPTGAAGGSPLSGWAVPERPPERTSEPRPPVQSTPLQGTPLQRVPVHHAPVQPAPEQQLPPPASKGRDRRRVAMVAAGLAAAAIVAWLAVGRDGGARPRAIRSEIAAALERQGMERVPASCVAGHVVDEIGTGELSKIDDFAGSSVPDGLRDGFADDFGRALQEGVRACGALLGSNSS
jgi:hypothetical protein